MTSTQTNLILRKKVIWVEIKSHEQEYSRICKQIRELEDAKKDISGRITKKLNESQEIAEKLDSIQYEIEKAEHDKK